MFQVLREVLLMQALSRISSDYHLVTSRKQVIGIVLFALRFQGYSV
jgi:hypothetical protein